MHDIFKKRVVRGYIDKPNLKDFADEEIINASESWIDFKLSLLKNERKALKKMDLPLQYMFLTSAIYQEIVEFGYEHVYLNLDHNMVDQAFKGFLDMRLPLFAQHMLLALEKAESNHQMMLKSDEANHKGDPLNPSFALFDDINTFFRTQTETFEKAYIAYARKYFC